MRPAESFINQPVRSLQTMLRVLAEADEQLLKVIPDGFYGAQTRNAIYRFQRLRGLTATGVTDLATWERISAEYAIAIVQVSPAQPIQILLDSGERIKKGDRRIELYLLQAVLIALSEAYCSVSRPEMTGVLDDATADSIATFQHLANLAQTGELDKITWKHMALHYSLASSICNAKSSGKNSKLR